MYCNGTTNTIAKIAPPPKVAGEETAGTPQPNSNIRVC